MIVSCTGRIVTEQRILTPGPLTPGQLAAEVQRLTSSPAEWVARVRLDPEGRWYERIHMTDDYEVWLISWLPGQSTGFHDHGGSAGAFGVVWGALDESVADAPRQAGTRATPVRGNPGGRGRRARLRPALRARRAELRRPARSRSACTPTRPRYPSMTRYNLTSRRPRGGRNGRGGRLVTGRPRRGALDRRDPGGRARPSRPGDPGRGVRRAVRGRRR